MNAKEVFELIKEFFIEEFEIEEDKITEEANLFEDLEMDSLDALDMVSMLESKIDIEVDEEELKSIRTVKDVVDYIMGQIKNAE